MLSVPPPARIPIGTATVGGQQVEFFLNPEWARYFNSLNTQVVTTSNEVLLPGPPGPPGAAGAAGAQGPQGGPGPALFLLQEPEYNDVFWPVKNT